MSMVNSPMELILASAGARPIFRIPSPQWSKGPFNVDADVANGAATNVSLTTQDAWYGDAGIRQSYSLTDGSTTDVQATVHVESVQLIMTAAAFSTLAGGTKDNVVGALYLEATISGTTIKTDLFGHITELFAPQAGAADYVTLKGQRKVLPFPLRVNLDVDSWALKSDADVALGAGNGTAKLVVGGIMFPKSANVEGAAPGACGSDMGPRGRFTTQQLRAAAIETLQVSQLEAVGDRLGS